MSFNRYMRGMSNGGSIFAGAEPLTPEELHAHVPSIFAEEAHESRSERFAPIPTATVLEGLRREGFDPFFAQQAKTRVPGKSDFTKHMVRMRHRSLARADGQAFEIILVNANDGTSSYQMIPGFFRFVCANGLMAGETFEDVKVRHTGDAVSEVIEGAYRVLDDAPRLTDQVERFRGLHLNRAEREAFAAAAHVLRFPDADQTDEQQRAPVDPATLLQPRRNADRGDDLWHTLNVVQENTLRGGQRGWVRNTKGRVSRRKVRPVNGIDQGKALNRALWTLAERMGELKAAA